MTTSYINHRDNVVFFQDILACYFLSTLLYSYSDAKMVIFLPCYQVNSSALPIIVFQYLAGSLNSNRGVL